MYVHYLIHQLCYKSSSGSFYPDLTEDVNIIDFTISLILVAILGVWMDKCIRKTVPALRNVV